MQIIESQNRIINVGEDYQDHQLQPQPISTMPTKPHPQVPRLQVFWTPPGWWLHHLFGKPPVMPEILPKINGGLGPQQLSFLSTQNFVLPAFLQQRKQHFISDLFISDGLEILISAIKSMQEGI